MKKSEWKRRAKLAQRAWGYQFGRAERLSGDAVTAQRKYERAQCEGDEARDEVARLACELVAAQARIAELEAQLATMRDGLECQLAAVRELAEDSEALWQEMTKPQTWTRVEDVCLAREHGKCLLDECHTITDDCVVAKREQPCSP